MTYKVRAMLLLLLLLLSDDSSLILLLLLLIEETLISCEKQLNNLYNVLDSAIATNNHHQYDLDKWCYGENMIWLIKPVAASCGDGIVIAKGIQQVLINMMKMNFKCVVQKYIEKPLLVRSNRKFDIRQWVVVTNDNPLVIYGFEEFYLRLSSREYTLTDSKLDDGLVHLCNQSVQHVNNIDNDDNDDAVSDTTSIPYESTTMMSQHEFDQYLQQINKQEYANKYPGRHEGIISCGQTFRVDNVILPQVQHLVVEVLKSVRDKISKFGKGFEWLGFDFMVSEDLDVKLLEVNVSPDVTLSTRVTKRLVPAATRGLFDLLLDDNDSSRKRTVDVESGDKSDENVVTNDKDDDLKWMLWYTGDKEDKRSLNKLTSIKLKTSGTLNLGDNIIPPHHNLVQRVLAVLSEDNLKNEQDDDDDEDEI